MRMHTEDEAKKLLCPQTMSVAETDNYLGGPFSCHGSACMAWRWDEAQPIEDYDSDFGSKHPDRRRGYCGLARS
jgi:hypothetical protein